MESVRRGSSEGKGLRGRENCGRAAVETGPMASPATECLVEATAIGMKAGEIWRCLRDDGNGDAPTAQVARTVGGSRVAFERALGWLAREDKVCFGGSEQGETIRLKK